VTKVLPKPYWAEKVHVINANSSHGGGSYYSSKNPDLPNDYPDGSWIGKGKNGSAALSCIKAVYEDVVSSAHHSDITVNLNVPAFLNCTNTNENHRKVILFLISNDLIPRTKKGTLHNIHFKKYMQGNINYTPKVALSDFVDLKTGMFIEH